MTVKLLSQHHLESLTKKGDAQARLSLHLSNCHIVGNHMSGLNYAFTITFESVARIRYKLK